MKSKTVQGKKRNYPVLFWIDEAKRNKLLDEIDYLLKQQDIGAIVYYREVVLEENK